MDTVDYGLPFRLMEAAAVNSCLNKIKVKYFS